MFRITIQYSEKGKTPGVFIVNPDHFRDIEGATLVEALAKFNIELVKLQQDLHDEEIVALKEKYINDDIPF